MGSSHSIRSTHFQRPNTNASVENIADDEFDDRSISITNKMVERLVEDATLAGGAATVAPPSKPKTEYRDKIYSEKLKCMDDSHSERCRIGYPRELCEVLSEVNSIRDQICTICSKQADIFTFICHCHQKVDECNENLTMLNQKIKSLETRVSHRLVSLTNFKPTATDPVMNYIWDDTQSDHGDHPTITQIQSLDESVPLPTDIFPTKKEGSDEMKKFMNDPCKGSVALNTSQSESIDRDASTSDESSRNVNGEVKENKEVYRDTEIQDAAICSTCGCSKRTGNDKKFIHICNITADSNEVRSHLRHLCANRRCSVQQINSRGDNKSYKIGVPIDLYDRVLSPKIWPESALIRPWVSKRISKKSITVDDLNAIANRIELRTANMVSVEPVCVDLKNIVIDCYNQIGSVENAVKCWDAVGDFTQCVSDAAGSRLRARTQREAREHARRTRHVALAREHALKDLASTSVLD